MNLATTAAIYHKAVHAGTPISEAKLFARKLREIKEKDENFSWWRLNEQLRRQNSAYTEQQCTAFMLRMRDLWKQLDKERDVHPDPEPAPPPRPSPEPEPAPSASPGGDRVWVNEYIYERAGKVIIASGHWRHKPKRHKVRAHVRVVKGRKVRVASHWRGKP